MISYKPFWIHQYLYFHEIYKGIVDTQQNLSAEAWNNIQSASPPGQNSRALSYVAFLFITLVDYTLFLIYSRNSTCYNFYPQSVPCLQTYSLGFILKQCDLEGCLGIDKSWIRTAKAAKVLTNFKHLKGVSTFLLILEKTTASHKTLREIRAAIAIVVWLVYLSSNSQIIILHFRTQLISKYKISQSATTIYTDIQINVLKGRY